MGSGYCTVHRRRKMKRYERERGTSTQRGYNAQWRRYRERFLARHPWCIECSKLAKVVDHIRPHKGSESLFWDPANHQAMCDSCHSSKTAREDGGFGNRMTGNARRSEGMGGGNFCRAQSRKPGGSEIFTGTLDDLGIS